jgi:hypothetical protein
MLGPVSRDFACGRRRQALVEHPEHHLKDCEEANQPIGLSAQDCNQDRNRNESQDARYEPPSDVGKNVGAKSPTAERRSDHEDFQFGPPITPRRLHRSRWSRRS